MNKSSKCTTTKSITVLVAFVAVLAIGICRSEDTIPPDSTETFSGSVLTWQRPRWQDEASIATDDGKEIKFRPFAMKNIYQRIYPSSKSIFDELWYSINAPEFPPEPPDPPDPPDPPEPPDTPTCDGDGCCENFVTDPTPIQVEYPTGRIKWGYYRWCSNKWQYIFDDPADDPKWISAIVSQSDVYYYQSTVYIHQDIDGHYETVAVPQYVKSNLSEIVPLPMVSPPGVEDGGKCLLYYQSYVYIFIDFSSIGLTNGRWKYQDHGGEWWYYSQLENIWKSGNPPKTFPLTFYWMMWWKYHSDWVDKLDPKFEIYAWFDRNGNGAADAGDVIGGETTLSADIDADSMRIPVKDIIGHIPAAPGLIQLGGDADLTAPTVPEDIEFIRYSEIDETSGELIVAPQGRGVMLRTAAGYSPLPPERPARAWPAGTPVRVRHLWELVHEGEFIIGDGEITNVPPEIAPGDFVSGDEITFETSKDSKVTAYNLLAGLDKDTILLKAGRSYLIQLYIATERGDTNIFPATWIPLIGVDSFWPLPDGKNLPGLDTEQPDTRQIRHLRINTPPK